MHKMVVGLLLSLFIPLCIASKVDVYAKSPQDQAAPQKETSPKKETVPKKTKDSPPVSPLTKSDCGKLGGEVIRDDRCGQGGYRCYLAATEKSLCIDDMSK